MEAHLQSTMINYYITITIKLGGNYGTCVISSIELLTFMLVEISISTAGN